MQTDKAKASEFDAWLLESLGNWARDVGGNPTGEDVDAMATAIEGKVAEIVCVLPQFSR